jgi:hypothetical protein
VAARADPSGLEVGGHRAGFLVEPAHRHDLLPPVDDEGQGARSGTAGGVLDAVGKGQQWHGASDPAV